MRKGGEKMKYYAVLDDNLYKKFIKMKQWYGYKETMVDSKHHIVFYNFDIETKAQSFENLLPFRCGKKWLKKIDKYLDTGYINEDSFIETERELLNEKKW